MGINAVAVLRIEPSVVEQALVAGADEGMRVGANGEPVKVRPLGNATLVHLGASIAQDPASLGQRLQALLGEVLVAHDEPRGVPLFPESYSLNAQSWDDAVAELGDGAEWIPLPQAQPQMPDLGAMLGAMGGMDALSEQLQGAGGAAMLEQAMAMAQQLAQSGALDGLAQQLQGAQSPEDALQKMGAPPDALALAMQDRLERRTERRDRPTRLAALAEASLAAGAAACGGARPPRSASAVVPAGARLIPADTRRCGASPFPTLSEAAADAEPEGTPNLRPHTGRTSLPERALLRMLRERIVPPARGCFREDRRGRAAYQRRAVFAFRLADREVVEARVEGSISDSLRQCLSQTMDGLDIPPFDGVVNVRYPIYVAPRLPPPVLSLDPAVADAVDSVTE